MTWELVPRERAAASLGVEGDSPEAAELLSSRLKQGLLNGSLLLVVNGHESFVGTQEEVRLMMSNTEGKEQEHE